MTAPYNAEGTGFEPASPVTGGRFLRPLSLPILNPSALHCANSLAEAKLGRYVPYPPI